MKPRGGEFQVLEACCNFAKPQGYSRSPCQNIDVLSGLSFKISFQWIVHENEGSGIWSVVCTSWSVRRFERNSGVIFSSAVLETEKERQKQSQLRSQNCE